MELGHCNDYILSYCVDICETVYDQVVIQEEQTLI